MWTVKPQPAATNFPLQQPGAAWHRLDSHLTIVIFSSLSSGAMYFLIFLLVQLCMENSVCLVVSTISRCLMARKLSDYLVHPTAKILGLPLSFTK